MFADMDACETNKTAIKTVHKKKRKKNRNQNEKLQNPFSTIKSLGLICIEWCL